MNLAPFTRKIDPMKTPFHSPTWSPFLPVGGEMEGLVEESRSSQEAGQASLGFLPMRTNVTPLPSALASSTPPLAKDNESS